MDVYLRLRHEFADWGEAAQFLREKRHHFLLSDEAPPKEFAKELARQILVESDLAEGGPIAIPVGLERNRLKDLCRWLVQADGGTLGPQIGSVQSAEFVAFLGEFAGLLKDKYDLNEVAQAITEKSCELFHAEGASIIVYHEEEKTFRFAHVTSQTPGISEQLKGVAVPVESGIVGWVATQGRSLLVDDVQHHPDFHQAVDEHTKFQTRDMLAAPILIEDRTIAVLEILNKKDGRFAQSDLEIVELIGAIIATFIEKARLYDQKVKFARFERELEIARTLQIHLMPTLPTQVGRFRLRGQSKQLSRVGGDFWDILRPNEHESLIILGDVSGHGLSAALVMSAVRTGLRALLAQVTEIRQVLPPLNQLLYEEFGSRNLYVTMIACHLDLRDHTVHVARAGHEYPLLGGSQGFELLQNQGGFPVGMLNFPYDVTWHPVQLDSENQLVMFTDGVVDGFGERTEPWWRALEQMDQLDVVLEQGRLMEELETFGWRECDDATLLQLVLEEEPEV